MMEDGQDVVDGIKLIMKHLELKRCFVGIEENKPEAIKKLGMLTEGSKEIPSSG
jgi:electron transport complex protein RnfC